VPDWLPQVTITPHVVFTVVQDVFAPYMVILFVAAGLWSALMEAPNMKNRNMHREAAVARWGGLAYIGFALSGYLAVGIYRWFFL